MIGLVVSGLFGVIACSASALTLGSLASSDPGPCTLGASTAWILQTGTASIPYSVPAGGGMITEWSTSFGPAGAPVELVVTGPQSAGNYPVVGFDAETLPNPIPAGNVSSFTLANPIAVQAGDLIGLFYTGSSNTRCLYMGGASDTVAAGTSAPTNGGALTPVTASAPNILTNVTVNLIQSDDVGISGGPPLATTVGSLAEFVFSLTGTPSSPSTVTDVLPPGLTPVDATTNGGSCSIGGQGVTCHSQATPGTVHVFALTTTAGTFSNLASVTGVISDPNPANNLASQLLTVSAPPAPPPATCKTIALAGAPLAIAKLVIPALNCTVGKVTSKASKTVHKGLVISTSPGAGATLAAGTAVNVFVSSGPPKKTKKKKKKKH